MSGAITGAVVVGGAMAYSTYESNKAADRRAADANAANSAAAEHSRQMAERDNKQRTDELYRRFKIKAAKTQDVSQQLDEAATMKLTSLDMALAQSESKTDNVLASHHVTGRLAERLLAAQSIAGSMQRGSILSGLEQQHRSIGDNLEMMRMNLDTQAMNLNIDTDNAILAANNQEVRGWQSSLSTGMAGVLASGVGGAASGANAGAAIYRGT